MESQKIINFLEPGSDNEKYFQTKKWYIINDQNNGQYDENSTLKFNTEVIKPNLCDFGDAYILVTGNVKIVGGNANTRFCFKGPSPFTRSVIHLNDTHIETAENVNFLTIKYADNYQDTVGSLYQFKRDEQPLNDNGNITPTTAINSESFKYKLNLVNRSSSGATDAFGNAGDAKYVATFITLKIITFNI